MHTVALGEGAAAVRRQVGPSAWAALEQLMVSTPVGAAGTHVVAASVRDVAAGLGISKNAAHRAMRRLTEVGMISPSQDRSTDGRFVAGTYRLTIPADVLAPAEHLDPPPPALASRSRSRPARSRPAAPDQLSLLAL